MCFPPHFHGSVNEHLSASDFPEYPWTCHFTFLLPPSLSRNVSSSVAACKNAEYLHLLEPATVARSPPKAAHGPMNSLTNHDSLYFPIQESLAGGQAAFRHPARPPWGKDSLCAFFLGRSTLLCRFWQTFCQKCLANHLVQRRRVRELSRLVPRYTDGSQLDCVLVHEHSRAGRQAAGWHRHCCVTLYLVAGNQLDCCCC